MIGGGIVGTAAALELARGGASVTLFEGTAIGSGASGRNSGSIQHPFDDVLAALHRASLDDYRRLGEEAPDLFALPPRPAGLLLLAPETDMAALEAERSAIRQVTPELHPTLLWAADVARLEPTLARDLGALRLETAYPVPPAAAVAAFARLAERAGARIVVGARARLDIERGRLAGIRVVGARPIPAGAVLVAAGPWSPALVDPAGGWQPIVRTWGVTVATRLATPPRHVLEGYEAVSINRPEGLGADELEGEPDRPVPSTFSLVTARGVSVVGSTFLPDEPDPGSVGPLLLQRADRFVPGLHGAGIDELRACARPQSLDGRPLVGHVPDQEHLYIAAGHGPWGISTGPATARLVAHLILGRTVTVPPALDAGRFPR